MRFPEFEDEWKEEKLEKIARFSKGKGISKSDISIDGSIECIRYGQLYTEYSEVIEKIVSKTNLDKKELILSEENDVIIPASGESQIDIATASCVKKSGVALGGDLNIIKSEINGVFLSYYLNNTKKIDIAKLSQGISVVHLYSSQLKTLKLNLPSSKEQTKIADFLTVINFRIQTQNKIVEDLKSLSKGLQQKIFSQQIRFKDDTGNDFPEWETKKMDSFLSIPLKETPKQIDTSKIISVKLHLKGIHVNERTESLKIGATKYIIRRKGQFIYGKQNLFNGAFGIIPKELDGYLSSGDIPALNINRDLINPKFLYFFLGRKSFYKGLEKLASGSGSKRIHEKTLLKLKIIIPSLEEQTKIANFLSPLDAKLEKEKQLLEQYQQQKKYLLQNLFV
ncbi:MAG: restriction endonuclease subunit S [Mesonia hippocampi]|uniref:restriction endonuclease subunit S n=2 Tax=Mesonia hippocampi TaxID=1628250 RepID=UPI003F9D8AE0